jgi:hypothetical protein
MKSVLLIAGALIAVLVLLGSLTPTAVSAQGPTPTPAAAPPAAAAGTNVDDPAKAVAIASQGQSIPANSVQWYKFDYTTNGQTIPRPPVTITMLNGIPNNLGFEVYTPEQMASNWFDNKPIGKGTQQVVLDCTNDASGRCTTNNLFWTGGFGLDGTYFVRVLNNGNAAAAPQLIFSGPGLANCQNTPTTAAAPAAAPAAGQPSVQVQCTP